MTLLLAALLWHPPVTEPRRVVALVSNHRCALAEYAPIFPLLDGGTVDLTKHKGPRRYALEGGHILVVRSAGRDSADYSIVVPAWRRT